MNPINNPGILQRLRRLWGSTCLTGLLLLSSAPAFALDGTDAELKNAYENIEKQTTKNIPRLVTGVGVGAAFGYSLMTQNAKPVLYAGVIALGYGGVSKWVDKTFAVTLDSPDLALFLNNDEAGQETLAHLASSTYEDKH